jgi:hypothetical protein
MKMVGGAILLSILEGFLRAAARLSHIINNGKRKN